MRVINASKFHDYLLCPSLYNYKYLQNFQEVLYENNDEARLGTIIHNLIDAHFKEIPLSKEHFEEKKIRDWFNYYTENYLPDKEQDIYSEYSFNIPVDTITEKVILSGRIDRIIFSDNKITIIDWKSNSRKTKISSFISNLQMEFYAYAISKIKEVENIELKLIYLDLKEELNKQIRYSELESIEKKLFAMIKGTNKAVKSYIPNPLMIDKDIPVCRVCQFYNLCENLL